jgi:hypothetical protein
MTEAISGLTTTLKIGKWAALGSFFLFALYDIIIVIGIAMYGDLKGEYLTIAEVLSILGTPLLILLMAAIHKYAPESAKVFSLTALGWTLLLTGLTVPVHFVNLTLLNQLNIEQRRNYARFIGWEWPSMLYSVELAAWHLCFGLSLFFAAFAFKANNRELIVRNGLIISGLLCIIGLIGPLTGYLNLRMIGVFGYGILFPIMCVYISHIFKNALTQD